MITEAYKFKYYTEFNNDRELLKVKIQDDTQSRQSCVSGSRFQLAYAQYWDMVKDIGGEDAFNQEYGLRFINSSKSLVLLKKLKR